MNLISDYKVITVTHHNLELHEIANFYVQRKDEGELDQRLQDIKSAFDISECMYLETCNRVSFIIVCPQYCDDSFLKDFFRMVNPQLDDQVVDNIRKYVSVFTAENALQHVFELASSMDSLVVGEREILRQFRKAYDHSKSSGLSADRIRLLEKAAVKTAKSVYHNTGIGEKALSVVSLAMQALKKRQLSKSARILLVGSGETNTLVAKFLQKYAYEDITIYNRSLDNAQDLSDSLGAEAYHISELENVNARFDVIFICTAANKVIIDTQLYRDMVAHDKSKKLIIDLAVPRNVDPKITDLFNVEYIDIESLRHLSEENLKYRQEELKKAFPIIQKNIHDFITMFHQRNVETSLSHVPVEIQSIKERALNLVYRERLEQLDPDSRDLVEEMMSYMQKKCVSVPMRLAREGVRSGQRI